MDEELRYPIGRVQFEPALAPARRAELIQQVAEAPARIRAALDGLSDDRLDTPYRPGGWTVRQVVHHVADSHVNAYTRFKLALTEERPTIRTYDEKGWAETADARTAAPELSLALLDHLHARWVLALRALPPADFGRVVVHPESGELTLDRLLQLYAWHGRHHTAHITSLRERMQW